MVAEKTKIKKGYKHTETGIIPEDWDLISYDDAFYFLGTTAYSREQLSGVGEIQCIHYGDIHTKWDHLLDLDKNRLPAVRTPGLKSFDFIRDGDLVVADASEDYEGVAKSVEIKNIGTKKVIAGLHTFLLRDKENNFVDGFKGYLHSNILIKKSIDRYATGIKVFSISKSNLKLVQIPRPPKKEQIAIATALSDIDLLIDRQHNFIKKKNNIKRATMQRLITGKSRLPNFTEPWENKRLDEVANFIRGKNLSKSDLKTEGKYKCIHYGQLFTDYNEVIKEIKSKTDIHYGQVYSKENDVLMPTSDVTPRGLATASCIKENGIVLGGGILVIRFKERYDGLFFSYFVSQNKSSILKLVKGSTVFHLYESDLKSLVVRFPKYEEQVAIAKLLSDMDTEIDQLQKQLEKYKVIKIGMMQQLLTGKILIYGKK